MDPKVLTQAMDLLELACMCQPTAVPQATDGVTARTWALALEVLLGRILGSPPNPDLNPARLLDLTQKMAAVGLVPFALSGQLRQKLVHQATKLKVGGFWHEAQPLWWEPLPEPTRWELLHQELLVHLVSGFDQATENFKQLASLRQLLPQDFIEALWQELEQAHEAGQLVLEREGTGLQGKISHHRWDEVAYLGGLESWLVSQLPHLALLIQLFRNNLLERVHLPRPCLPPRNAMLARYPAPSGGYNRHLDNPTGKHENGRTLTLVVYLNPPGNTPKGGTLVAWPDPSSDSTIEHLPQGGSAVLFDARNTPHRVLPLQAGPHRWSLTFWFNDSMLEPPQLKMPVPDLCSSRLLVNQRHWPLPDETILFHLLEDLNPQGRLLAVARSNLVPRVGIVSTVYAADALLDSWCSWHFSQGIEHIFLIFDHLPEVGEERCARRLIQKWGERLSISCGETLMQTRWPGLAHEFYEEQLFQLAASGSSSSAVCARQTLNAGYALHRASQDLELDWLVHLDADELLYPMGPNAGGSDLIQHFAAATSAGYHLVRFINHELALPHSGRPQFKINPRLAAARLGTLGWRHLSSALEGARRGYYFNGYQNGKSAVRVSSARAAAGVHGWYLHQTADEHNSCLVSGPAILHFHLSTPQRFREKYLLMASQNSDSPRLFPPAPAEEEALALIESSRAAGLPETELWARLEELALRITQISPADLELLETSNLLLSPEDLPELDQN